MTSLRRRHNVLMLGGICCANLQFELSFSVDAVKEIKYKPKELFSYNLKVFDKLEEAVKMDSSLSDLWSVEYKFQWHDWQTATEGGIDLFDSIGY